MSGADRDEPSFDPRSWVSRAPDAAASAPGASAAKTPAPETSASLERPSRRTALMLAGGGAAAALLAGGGLIFLRRPRPGGKAAASKVPAGSAPPAGALSRSMVIAGPGDLADALSAAGVEAAEATRVAQAAQASLAASAGDLRVGLSLAPGPPPRFLQVEVRRADGSGVLVKGAADGRLAASPLGSDFKTKVKVVRGEMDANSFYSSAVAAGVTDSLISDFANAFAFDFDFQREIKPGDIFEAAFEQQVNGAGQVVGAERLVYASLQTQAKSRALYRFAPPGEKAAAWFDGNGASVARSLMRTPVEGARITSSFGPRMHPVLGFTRVHKGTDFATPVGTPVYASGDGVIDFVGVHGGHGNYMRVRHSPTLETAYAHLSAYGAGMAVGTAVRQGQAIALSGNTGLSSGPHLHYEVIVRDEQVDPMTFETASGRSLQGAALTAFRTERDRIDALRAAQNG
ncbi:MAG: M23 family metallopeptidase [Phenylobacterium sp.]